jgi:hypothetical protein
MYNAKFKLGIKTGVTTTVYLEGQLPLLFMAKFSGTVLLGTGTENDPYQGYWTLPLI